MSTLCLTLKAPPPQRVDLSPLSTDRLAGKSPTEVAAIELASGNRRVRVDTLFDIAGHSATEIEIRGACDRLDRIGAGMSRGRVVIRGEAGAYLGAGMTGGLIEVHGSAGAYAGTGMQDGTVLITGNAGDFLAAALPGDRWGMTGGTLVVGGDAGDRAGDRMRRGMVLIEGNAGAYCAARMVAGTLAVWGSVGPFPGLAMRRGTLLLRTVPGALLPTFSDCGEHPHGFLTLLLRSWRGLPSRFAALPDRDLRARRFMGDRAGGGVGEILVLA